MKLFVSKGKALFLISILAMCCVIESNSQSSSYAITGVVTDSVTGKPIESIAVSLEKSKIGTLTDEEGEFRLTNNRTTKATLILSGMGYKTKEITVLPGKYYKLQIKMVSDGIQIGEVVIRQTKEKYSKKNNPAVDLIKKVIEHKYKNYVESEDYWRCSEYERIFFALNDYNPNKGILKNQKYLAKYADTSRIDGRKILPYTVREYYRDVYHRKSPKETKKIVLGYNQQGIDKKMDNSGFASATDETFKDINIRDNQINLFLIGFVGPLSTSSSIDFYKWYIRDTVMIDNKKFIQLGFLPFNTRDVGFSGDLFVRDDSTYAIKKVLLRIPKKANINFVKTMLVEQEFDQLKSGLWTPSRFTTMVNFEYEKIGKLYVQKDQTFTNISTGLNYKEIFAIPDQEIKMKGYDNQENKFWQENRPTTGVKDLRLDSMYIEATRSKTVKFAIKVADFLQSGYIHTIWDPKLNKLDIGSAQTFYSTNSLEGTRLRMGALTTANFNHNLFLYGYGAYGTSDKIWKYYGEVAWAFKRRELIKDEFPRKNLTISYKYDVNTLGQRYLQASRDNFLQSFKIRDIDNMTYQREIEINYVHESQKGFSAMVFARKSDESAGGNLTFIHSGDGTSLGSMKTTEVGVTLRYAHNEKFVQMKRKREQIPSESTIVTFENTWGLNNILSGNYSYHVMGLGLEKAKWIPPFGKLFLSVKAEKIWGEVPFPLLLTPNANNSYTIQRGAFNLITPLEFINDRQLTFMLDYHMGGWLFNRVPFIKAFKLREVFGFHGLLGDLSDRNNPNSDNNLLIFPDIRHSMGSTPYMEYNVGVENIFKFFRVDYVRRLNYLNHPDIDKSGVRFGFRMQF
jgi:hypothetical protein